MKPFQNLILITGGGTLLGTLAGGLLSFGAAKFGPALWQAANASPEFWTVGLPTTLGAMAGGALGGGLAFLGISVQGLLLWRKRHAC